MDWLLDGKTGLFTYYEYDPAGRVRLQHYPNATATYFAYDIAGRLGEKVTVKDSDASVLVRFAYTRDAAGNPIAVEREAALGAFYYEYDDLQRLAYEGQFVGGDREYENYYEYDSAGNRTLLRHGETGAEDLTYYAYNGANELTQLHNAAGWTYFGYDQNGNTVMEQAPSSTRYFDWDGRDMLVGVRSTEQGWTDNEIRYDGLASRAELVDSTGTTRYAWDGIRVLKLEDEEGTLKQRQVHGHAPIPSVGDIALMESAEGDPYAPIPDQVGTVCKVLGSAGAVANAYQYDAFGVSRAVSESFANPFRFAGKPLDADSALYHFIARQYRPAAGLFVARDPLARVIRDAYGGALNGDAEESLPFDLRWPISPAHLISGGGLGPGSDIVLYLQDYYSGTLDGLMLLGRHRECRNVYGYARGTPVAAADPMGLYYVRLQDCAHLSAGQLDLLTSAATAACDCLKVFAALDDKNIPSVWKTAQPCKDLLTTDLTRIRPETRKVVAKSIAKMCGDEIPIECECASTGPCGDPGVPAYYKLWGDVHICPSFFGPGYSDIERLKSVIHEMTHAGGAGHKIGPKNAYTFEHCIHQLCSGAYTRTA